MKNLKKDISEIKTEVVNVAKKLNDEIGSLNKKLSENKVRMDKHIEGLKDDIVKLVQTKIDDKMKETDDKLVKAVESKVEDHLVTVTKNIDAIKNDVNEQKERELRACNIIIYNVPEAGSESMQERISEDQQFYIDTFNRVLKVKILMT